jgi:hypothetical protein
LAAIAASATMPTTEMPPRRAVPGAVEGEACGGA